MMSISFESEEIILKKLRERPRRMTDEELTKFGKDVRRLAENPFQKQLEEARRSGSEGNYNRRVRLAERRKTVFVSYNKELESRIINQQASVSGASAVCWRLQSRGASIIRFCG